MKITDEMRAALDVRFDSDAGKNLSVREYLRELLLTLWREEDGFSGKRPFGNSGWTYYLFVTLAAAGYIKAKKVGYGDGTFDFEITDVREAHAFVEGVIRAAFEPVLT